ncbi:MAG: hypothetical protein FWE03_04840 [Firmicutes bacterium]|nr:hypothetical protein [Bacillota bacterium]
MKKRAIAIILSLFLSIGFLVSFSSCACEFNSGQRFMLTIEGGYVFDSRMHKNNWDFDYASPPNFGLVRAGVSVYIVRGTAVLEDESFRWLKGDEVVSNQDSFSFVMPNENVIIRADWAINNDINDPYELPRGGYMPRMIIDYPYTPRHNGMISEVGVLWELPVLRSGQVEHQSFVNRDDRRWVGNNFMLIIDDYDTLNSKRLGDSDFNFPIEHSYTREFFDNYVLWFVAESFVSGTVEFVSLVTCGINMFAVFKFETTHNYYPAPDGFYDFRYLLEIPRVFLDYYTPEWHGIYLGDNKVRWEWGDDTVRTMNRLDDVKKEYCNLLFGLHEGACDADLIENDLLSIIFDEDRIIFDGRSGLRYRVYNQNGDQFLFDIWTHNRILHPLTWLNLTLGYNNIKIKSAQFLSAEGVWYRYFKVKIIYLASAIALDSAYNFRIDGMKGDHFLNWDNILLHRLYIRRAGQENYSVGTNAVSRSVRIRDLNLNHGINSVKLALYRYHNGTVFKSEVRHQIELSGDIDVEYDFWLGNRNWGGSGLRVTNTTINWDAEGVYRVYIKRAGQSDFWLHSSWNSNGEVFIYDLFNEGSHQIKLRQLAYVDGVLGYRVSIFEFYYEIVDVTHLINLRWQGGYLRWDGFGAMQFIAYSTICLWAWTWDNVFILGGESFNGNNGSISTYCMRAVRLEFGWRFDNGTLYRYVAYWRRD